jgi:hypothetical protein
MRDAAPSRLRIASPATAAATLLGGLCLLVILAATPLEISNPGTFSVNGSDPLSDTTGVVLVVAFAAVGLVIARRQPGNPLGWLLLGATLLFELGAYTPSYTNLDHLERNGTLPLGHVALLFSSAFIYGLMMLPPILLLFPDGGIGRAWRRVLWVCALFCLFDVAMTVSVAVDDFRLRHPLDSSGTLIGLFPHRGVVDKAEALGLLSVFVLSALAAIRQIRNYRRASGERRQQLKWLGSGAAVCAVLLPTFLWSNAPSLIPDLVPLGLTAVPVAIGMGILRHRLYEIDRLISRTLSYAILTALLAGTFIGLIALTTDTLALPGRVGVAASTLAAAALLGPLRVRVQRLVDRRFNRARYDAEATVTAFTARLRDAVEIDAIRGDLLNAVHHAVEPAHASV